MSYLRITLLVALFLPMTAEATDRYYYDIHIKSKSQRFQVDATSPDNKVKDYIAFQASFTYTCIDTTTDKKLWIRKQAMEKPQRLSPDSNDTITLPKEASPVGIDVSDSGTTLIHTASSDLIVVSPSGTDVGKINLYKDVLNADEKKKSVLQTTARPSWVSSYVQYFVSTTSGEFLAIRPCWGRILFINLKNAKVVAGYPELIATARKTEADLIIASLQSKQNNKHEFSKTDAAYLAGALKMKYTVSLLKKLELSEYSGTSIFGGQSFGQDYENEVDPHSYSTYTLRQVAQLSLRRLGEKPKLLPCYQFQITRHGKSKPFIPAPQLQPRHTAIEDVKVGMTAKAVLNLIGTPDSVRHATWSYDMDSPAPFSIILTFDAKQVTKIKRELPL